MPSPASYLIDGFLARHPLTTVSEMAKAGVTRSALAAAVERGDVVRIGTGIVCSPSAQEDPLLDYAAACLATGGIVCGGTAGMHHRLTDEVSGEIEVLVPTATSRGAGLARMPVRRIRSAIPESFTLGVERIEALGTLLRITDRPRTVVDLFRLGARQHAVAALTTYLSEGGDGDGIRRMAEPFGTWGRIAPLVEVALDGISRPAP